MSAAVLGSAGGAELHQVGVSLGDKAVGGFALTLPILGINVFLCRHIVSHFAPDYAITCTHRVFLSLKSVLFVAYETVDRLP